MPAIVGMPQQRAAERKGGGVCVCMCVRARRVSGFYAQFKLLLFKDALSCVGNLATVGLNYQLVWMHA